MNYYEHHLGDWAQATAHLTFVEEAAYLRLVRWYYAEERPLPADERAIFRLARASNEAERDAVKAVLADFFELRDDGYHQPRCDRELARYREKREKARGSANQRWNSERNANASTKDANASESDAKAMLRNESSHAIRNALQSPDSSHQTPREEETPHSPPLAGADAGSGRPATPAADAPAEKPKRKAKPEDRGTRIPDPFLLTTEMRAWAADEVPGVDVVAATKEFVDYWRDVPGQRGRKVSWSGTWKNRMREVYAKRRPMNGHTPKPSSVDADGIPTWATAEERAELLRLKAQETARADH